MSTANNAPALSAREVAAEFGHHGAHAADWLARARPALEARGFPRPLPRATPRAAWRWPAAEVRAWIAAERAGVPQPANDPSGPPPDLRAVRRARLLASL